MKALVPSVPPFSHYIHIHKLVPILQISRGFCFVFFKFDSKGVKILIFLVMQLSTLAFTAGGKKGTVHCLLKYMPSKQ